MNAFQKLRSVGAMELSRVGNARVIAHKKQIVGPFRTAVRVHMFGVRVEMRKGRRCRTTLIGACTVHFPEPKLLQPGTGGQSR